MLQRRTTTAPFPGRHGSQTGNRSRRAIEPWGRTRAMPTPDCAILVDAGGAESAAGRGEAEGGGRRGRSGRKVAHYPGRDAVDIGRGQVAAFVTGRVGIAEVISR